MKIHVLSLGCARALVDSEGLAGLLKEAGHSLSHEPQSADCVVVNTCSFIREAEEESVATILDLAELKKTGKIRRLYVAGCLPQKRRNEKEDMLSLLPEVDGFLGPGDLSKLPMLIERQESGKPDRFFVTSPVPTLLFESTAPRQRLTPKHFAYVKVSEGCDHACTFCSIPQFRGAHRSRSIEDISAEVRQLVSEGVKEFNLIGQDSSYYGADIYGKPCLPKLLRALSEIPDVRWIRILYAHPAHVTDDLIAAIRDCKPVVKYIDIPLQHINDRLLRAMRRETDGDYIRRLVRKFREQVPGMVIRSTFIVGFPGETDADADELEAFLGEARFERVGMFPFSPEPKTPSEKMAEQVPDDVKKKRLDQLMRRQQEISYSINQGWIGREMEVLIEEPDSEDKTLFMGRSYADAPEVDGQVFVKSPAPLAVGELVRVKITDAYEYDLFGEVIP